MVSFMIYFVLSLFSYNIADDKRADQCVTNLFLYFGDRVLLFVCVLVRLPLGAF